MPVKFNGCMLRDPIISEVSMTLAGQLTFASSLLWHFPSVCRLQDSTRYSLHDAIL